LINLFRRSQRQRISPSPEPQLMTAINPSSPLDLSHSSQLFSKIPATPLPNVDHAIQSKVTNNLLQTPASIDQQKSHLSDSVNKNL
jgi:hypothetical protein